MAPFGMAAMFMICRVCGRTSGWHVSGQCNACRSVRPSTFRYDARWRRVRTAYLRANPGCVWTDADGRVCGRVATDVDHVTPLSRGGADDTSNYQALCHEHHSTKTVNEFANAYRSVRRQRAGGS